MTATSPTETNNAAAKYVHVIDDIDADNDWEDAVDAAFLAMGPLAMMLEELRGYDFVGFPYSDLDACAAVLREGARRGYRPHTSAENVFLGQLSGEMLLAESHLDDLLADIGPAEADAER